MALERLQHPALNCRHTLQSRIHYLRNAICFNPCKSQSELLHWSLCYMAFMFTLPAAKPAASGFLHRKDARFRLKPEHHNHPRHICHPNLEGSTLAACRVNSYALSEVSGRKKYLIFLKMFTNFQ